MKKPVFITSLAIILTLSLSVPAFAMGDLTFDANGTPILPTVTAEELAKMKADSKRDTQIHNVIMNAVGEQQAKNDAAKAKTDALAKAKAPVVKAAAKVPAKKVVAPVKKAVIKKVTPIKKPVVIKPVVKTTSKTNQKKK